MPPQTRGIKTLKENYVTAGKNKAKNNAKVNRKPLTDKTNSASDDNVSILSSNKILKKDTKKCPGETAIVKERSRRSRRLPTRYEENNILKNLSNFNSLFPQKDNSSTTRKDTSPKTNLALLTPHKTPLRISNSPLVSKRPKRICRLPSKFDEKSVSPTNNRSIQPSHASTPICNKLKNQISQHELKNEELHKKVQNTKELQRNKKTKPVSKKLVERESLQTKTKNKLVANKKKATTASSEIISNKPASKKDTTKNISFRLLDDKKKTLKRDSSKLDVYEFTFDPNEEPPPQKKKKKKNTKNPNKPKRVVKSIYEKNLEKVLASLKNTVSSKNKIQSPTQEEIMENKEPILKNNNNKVPPTNQSNSNVSGVSENKYNSIRVEDIAMQFQETNDDDHNNIDYSPVNSPHHALSSPVPTNVTCQTSAQALLSSSIPSKGESSERPINNKDPLNLQDDLSFFDEQPVASSSMNVSTRHPLASPWRVEFNELPIKWPVNSYVKPNLTPAIERSFINYNDNQKKHVYTNIITEANESLPQIVDNTQSHTSNLKQTSIISFIKEVAERKEKKKKHKIIKNNSLFDDVTHISEPIISRKNDGIPEVIVERSNTSGEDIQSENENACQANTKHSTEDLSEKEKDKDITYFGFDDSENQENVSPVKKKTKKKASKTQTRTALQVINGEVNSSRNNPMPIAPMSKPARIPQFNKIFEETKTATEAPAFLEQNYDKNIETTNVNDDLMQSNINDDDSQSVHLFEDIEFVHHLKPSRKSYSKSKKVTFRQNTDVKNQDSDIENKQSSDEEDNLDDLTFKISPLKEKKATKKKSKKQQKSKKEEKEVEEWAAGFNSMCEDIEEFDLVVE